MSTVAFEANQQANNYYISVVVLIVVLYTQTLPGRLISVTYYDRFQFISVRGLCIYSSNRATKCSVFLYNEPNASQSMICHSEFFVERLRYEKPQVFTDLVLSNITRLIDLPGEEFAQLTGDSEPRLPSSSSNGFLRSFNFLKRKGSPFAATEVDQ